MHRQNVKPAAKMQPTRSKVCSWREAEQTLNSLSSLLEAKSGLETESKRCLLMNFGQCKHLAGQLANDRWRLRFTSFAYSSSSLGSLDSALNELSLPLWLALKWRLPLGLPPNGLPKRLLLGLALLHLRVLNLNNNNNNNVAQSRLQLRLIVARKLA